MSWGPNTQHKILWGQLCSNHHSQGHTPDFYRRDRGRRFGKKESQNAVPFCNGLVLADGMFLNKDQKIPQW
jgi:hypothetical protein